MTDEEFIAAFEDQTFPREDWNHEAHVRMGWIYARREPSTDVIVGKVRTGLRELSFAFKGHADLYHETVTVAFVEIIWHRAHAPGAPEDWPGFRDAHPDLLDRECPVLLDYYRQETLDSDLAKSSFVPPELAPFSPNANVAP